MWRELANTFCYPFLTDFWRCSTEDLQNIKGFNIHFWKAKSRTDNKPPLPSEEIEGLAKKPEVQVRNGQHLWWWETLPLWFYSRWQYWQVCGEDLLNVFLHGQKFYILPSLLGSLKRWLLAHRLLTLTFTNEQIKIIRDTQWWKSCLQLSCSQMSMLLGWRRLRTSFIQCASAKVPGPCTSLGVEAVLYFNCPGSKIFLYKNLSQLVLRGQVSKSPCDLYSNMTNW